MTGIPVIAEIMFSDFIAVCFDLLANEIAKSRYMTGGQVTIPIVVRTANGVVPVSAHSTPRAWRTGRDDDPRSQGRCPSTPLDVVGLSRARYVTPTRWFSSSTSRSWPTSRTSRMVRSSTSQRGQGGSRGHRLHHRRPCVDGAPGLEAAGRLEEQGISAEVIDLRTLVPLDTQAIRIGEQDQPSVHR